MTDTRSKRSRVKPIKDGYLPITELTSPMSAAGSPFGDNQTFPLAVETLAYEHSQPQPPRER